MTIRHKVEVFDRGNSAIDRLLQQCGRQHNMSACRIDIQFH
ncbi:Uncharacterised protein [Vibrio cholerae]|nr:Uncharacterised protein [Vibrio cholerae]CSD10825.1 Uncharacterised protein [Vibrio cholerae]CSI31185.1 Uncharacterised protein [Vibrio cholerae]CSI71307.1 Uncharacterised protein [Vibrio cholerae]